MSTLATPEARPKAFTLGSRGLMSLVLLLVCTLLSAARVSAQTQVGSLSVTNPTYLAIDTDASGTRWLYVSNHGDLFGNNGGVVYKYNLTTGSTTGIAITTHGTADGSFISPDGIAIDPTTHDLFVADRYQNVIQRITNTGAFVTKFGAGQVHGPSGLALDGSGALYVAEHGDITGTPETWGVNGQHISKYTFTGTGNATVATQAWRKGARGTGNGEFLSTGPYGIAVSGGNVYVGDAFNYRVQYFDTANGNYVGQIATDGVAQPLGLSLDSSGNLWIGETSNSAPDQFDGSGSVQQIQKYSLGTSSFVQTIPIVPNNLSGFHAVLDAAANKLYVADYQQNQVLIYDLGGGSTAVPVVTNAVVSGTVGTPIASVQVSATNSPTQFDAPGLATYGLSISASGLITGTPSATATNATVPVTATNAGGTSTAATITLNINPAANTPVVSNASVSGSIGVAIAPVTVTATHSPTSFSAPDLAAFGLSIDAAGQITGTPTATALNAQIPVTATNASGTSAAATITLTVSPSVAYVPSNTSGPVVTTFDFPRGQTSNFYFDLVFSEPVTGVTTNSFVFTQVGNSQGTFDSIETVDASHYRLHFTFIQGAPGSFSFQIKTTGSGIVGSTSGLPYTGAGITMAVVPVTPHGDRGNQTLAPVVNSFAVGTSSGSTVNFVVTFNKETFGLASSNVAVNATGTAAGTVGYIQPIDDNATVWEIPVTFSGQGTLSLTLSDAAHNITDGVDNYYVGPDTSAVFTIPTTGAVPALNDTVVIGQVGAAITPVQVYASESPTSFSATGLAAYGLSISPGGLIYGTPTATATSQAIPVTATNAFGTSVSANVTLFISPAAPAGAAPVVTPANITGTVGVALSPVTVSASNSPTAFTAPGLANYGLSISNSGVITGTPSVTAVNATVPVTASNAYGSDTKNVTLNISAAASVPSITSATSASATVGTAFSYQITASGSPTSFGATGLTGTGLSLNATSGLISGTPTAAGPISVHLTAANGAGTSTAVTLTITVNAAPPSGSVPSITSATTASATVGSAFSYQIVATGTPTSYTADNLAGTGLSLNATSGVISGTPVSAGQITTHLTASNGIGASVPVTLTITVAPVAPPPPSAPVITSATTASATVGSAFNFQITASGSPSAFSADNLVGTGLALNAATGVIYGTPTSAGTIVTHLTATNGGGTSAAVTLTITVSGSTPPPPPPPPPVLQDQHLVFVSPTGAITVGDSIQLGATNTSGLPITYKVISGPATLTGSTLLVTGGGTPITVRASSAATATYAAATADVTFTANKKDQKITPPEFPSSVHTDSGSITLDATTSSGLPITYSIVSGNATIDGNKLVFTGSGTITVQATQAGNDSYGSSTTTFTLNANPVPRLVNISSRLRVSAGDANGASIAGFVVTGDKPKQILIRAVGPSLKAFDIAGPLANPSLTLVDAKGTVIGTNAGWNDDAAIAAASDKVYAFKLGAGSKDAALLITLQPGSYTAQVQSPDHSGTALIEVYDVSATEAVPTKQLINISTRGTVGTGDDVLIGGFSVSGNEPKKVLIRAVGPALTTFGVAGAVSDPIITVYSGTKIVGQNDNWGTEDASLSGSTAADISAAATATGAFPFAAGSADAAVVLTLQPGQYSAVVTGANNSTGAAMVEVYEIPDSAK